MRHYRNHDQHSFAPFGQIIEDIFNKSIGDIVGGDISLNTPSANTFETEEAYILEVAAPGIAKKDIDIELEKGHLIISSNIEKKEDSTYKRREFDYSKFKRRFKLKDNINVENISARYELGVLIITLPKLDAKAVNKKTKIKIG